MRYIFLIVGFVLLMGIQVPGYDMVPEFVGYIFIAIGIKVYDTYNRKFRRSFAYIVVAAFIFGVLITGFTQFMLQPIEGKYVSLDQIEDIAKTDAVIISYVKLFVLLLEIGFVRNFTLGVRKETLRSKNHNVTLFLFANIVFFVYLASVSLQLFVLFDWVQIPWIVSFINIIVVIRYIGLILLVLSTLHGFKGKESEDPYAL